MRNRIVENWLINSNEIGYQVPFCQLLIAKGYKLLHRTRHGPLEQGKDIIAIAPDGVPCAYQLKAGNISLSSWRLIRDEAGELVELPIVHPSLKKQTAHRSYLVTNGELAEEVRREIDDRNSKIWQPKKVGPLQTIVRGELLTDFQSIYEDFFPSDIPDLSIFLELYQENGSFPLNKIKVSTLLENILPIRNGEDEKMPKNKLIQIINAAVMIVSYILGGKIRFNNHIAIIDGWVILLAYIFAVIERYDLRVKELEQTVELIFSAVDAQFLLLIKELKSRTNFVEGSLLSDVAAYKPRITIVSGYLSAFGLYQHFRGLNDTQTDISQFLNQNARQTMFLCEAMTPLLVNNVLFRQIVGDTQHSRVLLTVLLEKILLENKPFTGLGMPDPYHNVEEVIRWQLGVPDVIEDETFRNMSYSLKSIIYMHARRNMRLEVEQKWRRICDIQFAEFIPDKSWHYFLWENRDDGDFQTRFPAEEQSWKTIVDDANKEYIDKLPRVFSNFPEFLPLFLNVYPHRFRPDMVMFLDQKINT